MQINQIKSQGVYDTTSVRSSKEATTTSIMDEIKADVRTGTTTKPFKAGVYNVGEKSELISTVNQTNKLISNISNVLSEETAEEMFSAGLDLDDISMEKIEKYISSGNNTSLKAVNKKLEKADRYMRALSEKRLPLNDANLSKEKRAYTVYDDVKKADGERRLAVLSSVYKKGGSSLKAISNAMKVPVKKKAVQMDDGKIVSHLNKLGLKNNDKNLGAAKNLLAINVPVNKKNISFLNGSNSMFDDNKMLGAIAGDIKKLGSGLGANLLGLGDDGLSKNQRLLDNINSINNKDIKKAADLGKTGSIKDVLSTRDEEGTEASSESTDGEETGGENTEKTSETSEATLRRQVEEVRLKMTLENADKLEKLGVNPETQKLAKLIEELRQIEKQELKIDMKIFDKNITDKEINQVYDNKLVIERIASLRTGFEAVFEEKSDINIENFSARVAVSKVESYLLTEIRADLGDSVVKSFASIESKLEILGIEVSEESISACKSLIRSGMDVTAENIAHVEVVAEQVDFLTKNLTPDVLLKISRAGIDIKSLPLDEAVDITRLYQSNGAENKLARLIARADINDADYKEIMATYKAIYKGLKKDGVAVANLLKSGADVNIKNLKIFSGYKGYSENINKSLDETTGLNQNAKKLDETSDLFKLEKVLIQFKLAKVVQSLTGENVKTILDGSKRETLPLADLARVLESELSEKEYFKGKNGEIVKKLIEMKIPVTFSNIEKAKDLSINKFKMIDDIASAIDEIENETEKSRITDELKRVLTEKSGSKEELETALMDLKADVDSEEFSSNSRFANVIKDMEFADEFDEVFLQLPYFAGDELRQLNIFSKERELRDEDEMEVVLALSTKSMGDKKINLSIYENRVSLFVKVDDADERSSFERFASDFEAAIRDAGFYFGGMNFSKLEDVEEEAEIDDVSSIISFKV